MKHEQILSCDWGTSSFRLRLIEVASCAILAEVSGGKGIAKVYNDWKNAGLPEEKRVGFYKKILQEHINQFANKIDTTIPLIISGMASSTIGMKELAYGSLPFNLSGDQLNIERLAADENMDHEIILVSGLQTNNDVMRGEETMLLGCELNADETLAIFPGTHSKHVVIIKNLVTTFKTYITGELFDLLATKSVLANSVIKKDNENYSHVFKKAVEEGCSSNLLNSAFHVRTNLLFKKFTAEENYHYLSGLVIGHELKEINCQKNIQLVCNQQLKQKYLDAIEIISPKSTVTSVNADEALIKAHCKLAILH